MTRAPTALPRWRRARLVLAGALLACGDECREPIGPSAAGPTRFVLLGGPTLVYEDSARAVRLFTDTLRFAVRRGRYYRAALVGLSEGDGGEQQLRYPTDTASAPYRRERYAAALDSLALAPGLPLTRGSWVPLLGDTVAVTYWSPDGRQRSALYLGQRP